MNKSVLTLLLFGGAAAVSVFLVLPKYQATEGFSGQIEEKRLLLQQQEDYYRKLGELEEKLKGYEESMEKVNTALPEDAGIPDLYNFLQRASSENGLILDNAGTFTLSGAKKEGEVGEAQVNFSVTGSYSSMKKFLNALEKSARLIELKGISFTSPTEGDIFKFSLTVKVNFMPTKK